MKYVVDDFAAMRSALAAMCEALKGLPEGILFDSKLVACELLSNVLQHGGGRAHFSYAQEDGEIRISVRGENGYRPPEVSRCASVEAECGRGLFLVDTIVQKREYTEQDGVSVVIMIKGGEM